MSLLNKAKSLRVNKESRKSTLDNFDTRELVELTIAYLHGEITTRMGNEALGINRPSGGFAYLASSILRKAIAEDIIEIKFKEELTN